MAEALSPKVSQVGAGSGLWQTQAQWPLSKWPIGKEISEQATVLLHYDQTWVKFQGAHMIMFTFLRDLYRAPICTDARWVHFVECEKNLKKKWG